MYIPTPSPEAIEYANTISRLLGWSYVFCWGVSSYPQLITNYRRKAVTGLALDYFTVNVLGFTCYTISSALFLFSSTVRAQYARRHPLSPEPTVRWNDLAFAGHATLISIVTLSQFWFWRYKRDASQRLSSTMVAIIAACIAAVAIAILRVRVPAATGWQWEWIDVVYTLQYVKLAISFVKYIPQAWLNYQRKATTGWSIENILLDCAGGFLSLGQLVLDSSLQGDWSGMTGNPAKFFLSQISIAFDIVFIVQHYILYPPARVVAVAPVAPVPGYGTILPGRPLGLRRGVEQAHAEERRGLLTGSLEEGFPR
ncbi:hypothetical protein Q9L58_002683 [Maublancomyces gigas]|uniref:Cystinosin n=1 Tax=Discina gigas TaxID=1032678 RepID=A0ABR3GQN6_9PEZI